MNARCSIRISPLFSVSSVLNLFPDFRPPRHQISFNPNCTCPEERAAPETKMYKRRVQAYDFSFSAIAIRTFPIRIKSI
jgi:hypothetical protein